jgi:hypothetical protein
MKVSDLVLFDTKELVSRLHDVTMLTDKASKPYAHAKIQVADIDTTIMSPAQCYVLRDEFEKVRLLRHTIAAMSGIDILRMADTRVQNGMVVKGGSGLQLGYIEYKVTYQDGSTQVHTMLPPIIEMSREANGTLHRIINDGQHRCYLARHSMTIPAVVFIEAVAAGMPYYAYPLPGGWDQVRMATSLSDSILKKYHRFLPPHEAKELGVKSYKDYYRDFNSAFANVGQPRGTTTK